MCLSLLSVCWNTSFLFSVKMLEEGEEPEIPPPSETAEPEEPNEKSSKVVKKYNKSFSMYAETDLDQPTDYSLRYAEDDSDSDDCEIEIPKTNTEFLQDTVKTYCTEDTPYETPCNFSTATSMSDLRIDDKNLDEKLIASTVDQERKIPSSDPVEISGSRSKIKSEFSSGLMSPEKPVNYCEEGTPGYFSRVPSFGSLNSIPVNDPVVKSELKEEVITEKGDGKGTKRSVKFEEIVNYTEETPLMFSRSSSLASLDSIDEHSIHDDRSSVVSDFSRLTSGLISPSELPDSPSQTVPQSPKSRKSLMHFPESSTIDNETDLSKSRNEALPKSSVFEDHVKKFNIESTPIQFSTATSLSSLLIDDRDDETKNETVETSDDKDESAIEIGLEKLDINDDNNEPSDESDEEDENILAACINIGMQNNRYSQQKSAKISPPSEPSLDYKQNCGFTPTVSPKNLQVQSSTNAGVGEAVPKSSKTDISSDCLRAYCTEDTPALLSHAGSNSDLSVLSMQGTETKIEKDYELESIISDDDCDDERLLQDCIKRGMAQIAKSTGNQTSHEIGLDISLESNSECENNNLSRRSSMSSISECEKVLLEECIRAGMPLKTSKNNTLFAEESSDLTEAEQELLQQCILDGMNSIREKPTNSSTSYRNNRPTNNNNNSTSDLTEKERALLKQCILLGMQKKTPTASFRNSTELSESEQALLEQCIQAGMPRSRPTSSRGNKQVDGNSRRNREIERSYLTEQSGSSSHACCIHCPRNQQGQGSSSSVIRQSPISPGSNHNNMKTKKKFRGQEKSGEPPVGVRDTRDVNILYITSQILAMKKALVDRSHEEWV